MGSGLFSSAGTCENGGGGRAETMPKQDFTSHRLYVDGVLAEGALVPLTREQSNYLLNVLRLGEGTEMLVFNGRDGEWRARIRQPTRRDAALEMLRIERGQTPPSPHWYCFAPLKAARLDYMIQKAVEMGAGRIVPMLTRRTQVTRLKQERLGANAIEAAEQCGILTLPEIAEEIRLERLVAAMPAERRIVFCDEDAEVKDPLAALAGVGDAGLALMIGPEGGFAPEERELLLARAGTIRLSLGPRILRADTAAVAALAVVQAACGDWRGRS